ncbi:DUF357 domain-containing protein [Candidatus Woesearchaeota archaeon CG07_land_8_20_14_0_80_44_23]|nr:MAG: DUF357 domain-containing protein [Candidatus Woesearchaeota archaeon CG07_land_8_20_14_0_80_44_23]
MKNLITKEKLLKYFEITGKALSAAKKSPNRTSLSMERKEILQMAESYYSDAKHYYDKGDWVTAFASLNYAHGWLDAGARLGIFDVHNSEIFSAD